MFKIAVLLANWAFHPTWGVLLECGKRFWKRVSLYATSCGIGPQAGCVRVSSGFFSKNIPPKPKKGSNLFFEVQIVSLTFNNI
jgi:hypothetical protein